MNPGDLVRMSVSRDPGVGLILEEPVPCGPHGNRERVKLLWLDEDEVCFERVDWLEVINDRRKND
jgi:hypothetical protein